MLDSQPTKRADALVNLCGATVLRDEHLRVPVRIYLETDPVRPQIEVAQGRQYTIDLLTAHTHHFTFGENLGAGDCRVPVERFDYRPTRQPIVLDWWAPATRTAANGAGGRPLLPDDRFTTISSWKQSGKDVEWGGETEFVSMRHAYATLPEDTRRRIEGKVAVHSILYSRSTIANGCARASARTVRLRWRSSSCGAIP